MGKTEIPDNSGVSEPTDDGQNDEAKAAAKQAVANAKSKADAAAAKAADAKIKQDAVDAKNLLDGAKAELAKASDSTEGYGDANSAVQAAEEAVNAIPSDLPETLEGNDDQDEDEKQPTDASVMNNLNTVTTASVNGADIYAMEETQDVTITLKQPVVGSNGEVTSYEDLKNATISYMDNCADNKSNAVNKDAEFIKFKVTPVDGKKVTDVAYATATQSGEFGSPTLLGSNPTANQEFMIGEPVSALATAKFRVMIVVATTDVNYTINFSKSTGASTVAQISSTKNATSGAYESFSLAAASDETASVQYGRSLSFAVKGLGTDRNKVIVKAYKSSGSIDDAITLSGSVKNNGTAEDPDNVLEYTLRASDVKKLNKKDNDTIVVEISKPGEKSLTLKNSGSSFDGVTKDDTHVTVSTDAVATLTLDGTKYQSLTALGSNASYTVDKKIAFTTELVAYYADDWKILKPAAQWAEESDATTKKDLPVISEKSADGRAYWAIDLSSVTADGYMWLTIQAEPDESKPTVKTISFTGSNVKAAPDPDKDGSGTFTDTNNLVGKNAKTTDDEYGFVVEPKKGYVVTKIEATINKTYAEGTPATATETIVINKDGEKYTEENGGGLYDAFVDKEALKVVFSGRDKLESGEFRRWTAKTISVKITTETQKAGVDTGVIFSVDNHYNATGKGVYGYKVNTDGDLVVKSATVHAVNGYLVKKGTDSLEFTVTGVGKTAPEIWLNGVKYTDKAVSGNVYKIPVGELDASVTNTINIVRPTKTVTVKYAATNTVTASVKDADANSSERLADDTGAGAQTRTATVNVDAMTLIEIANGANKKADISSVQYWFGTNGAKKTVEKNAEGKYIIETKMEDDLTVEIKKSEDKILKVTYSEGGEVISKNEAGVYVVDDFEKAVKAEVLDGSETELALYSAVVKDGDQNAKTKAVIDSSNQKFVEITVDKSERGKDLKVQLVPLADRTPVEFTLRAGTAVEEIGYSGISEGKVSLPVDSEVVAKIDAAGGIKATDLEVLLLAGNAEVPANNLSSTMIPVSDGRKGDGRKVEDSNVRVTLYNDGSLVIEAIANASGEAVKDAAKIVLYDKRVTGDSRVALKGSEIKIDIEQATVKANALSQPVVSTTAKDIILNVTAPETLVKPKTGGLYYKVSVKAPTSGYENVKVGDKEFTGIADVVSAWAAGYPQYLSVDTVKAAGVIRLSPFANVAPIDGVEFPGMALDGFEVEVALAQTYDSSAAGDGNTIVGTAVKVEAATKKPSYVNTEVSKLTLKKEKDSTLYTGNTEWVAVATPDFGKSAAAYNAVETTMVDMKTGGPLGGGYGLASRYNDATGKVEVHFTNNTNQWWAQTNGRDFKDVGVKVTAVTEKTGYALAGTMKLSVVNGIECMNATAQPRVLKTAGKAASLKVDVSYNDETNDKKTAPKKKNVTYTIVGVGTTVTANHGLNPVNAPAKIAAAVTSKNNTSPTINIDKSYVVSGTPADNTFRVLVTANDYAGNKTYGLTDPIQITSESAPLGTMVVMKKGTSANWSNATIVSGKAEATQETGEFRAVILKPGVGTDRATYDLSGLTATADNAIAIRTGYVNFTPAKGNITVTNTGAIKVNKLGKVNLAAADKSNKKNVVKCQIEFVQKNTTLGLKLTQLKDSTFESAGRVSYDKTLTFSGNNTTYFGVDVVDDAGKTKDEIKLYNASVKFGKNLKNVTPKQPYDDYQYVVAMTGADAAITLQPKGGAAVTYTLKNEAYVNDKKAPKVTPENKAQKFTAGSQSDATYVLTPAVKGEKFDGMYVMLSVDGTKKNPVDIRDDWDNDGADGAFTDNNGVVYTDRAIAIREGGKFDLKFAPNMTGTYNLLVAVGELKDGVFTQKYPDAKLALKAGRRGSVKLKASGNYTLNPYMSSKVAINYNGDQKKAQFTNCDYQVVGGNTVRVIDPTKNYAKNAIVGNGENKFRDYFTAQEDIYGDIATIGLRDDITAEQLNTLLSNPKSEDLTGYISINNGDSYVDVKIKITLKTDTKSLKAVCDPVLAGDQVVADVKLMNGKEAVKVTDYTIVSAEGGITREQNRVDYLTNKKLSANGDVISGDIRLKADKLAAGKYKVSLKVTPENTPALNKNDDTRKTYEVPVDLTINVVKTDTKNKVEIAKGEDVWTVVKGDFVGPEGVENEPEQGSWQKAISYRFKNRLSVADGTKITVTADEKTPYVSFVSSDYSVDSATQTLTAVIDKKKLLAAVDGKKLKWGGKVTTTATFKYGNSGIKEDTVKLTITLPTVPGAELTDDKVFKDAETNIQNMVATMYDHYANAAEYDPADGTANAAKSEAIAKRIKEMLYETADGATVTVEVTYTPATALVEQYTAVVSTKTKANLYTHTFGKRVEKNAGDIINAIKTFTNNYDSTTSLMTDWVFTAKVTADMAGGVDKVAALVIELDELLAKEITKDTTGAQYAAFIRTVLTKTKQITSNINIEVETLENGRKAPTAAEPGFYKVKVTVTDKNKAPSAVGHSADMNILVNFGLVEATTTALDALRSVDDPSTDDVDERDARSLMRADNASDIVVKAWKAAATPGMEYTDKKFLDEVEKQLVENANKLIAQGGDDTTGNEALKATGIQEGTLVVSISGDALTVLKYTLLLTDTSGSKAKEEKINVNFTTSTADPAFQTIVQLKGKLTASNLTVKTVNDKAAAFAEIEKTIKEKLCTNPGLDLKDLKVEDAATPKFVAPTPKYDGLVSVKITCTGMTATTVNNIVILKGENDFIGDGSGSALILSKEKKRIEAALVAELNSEKLEKMYVDMQEAYAAAERTTLGSGTALNPATPLNVEKKITEFAGLVVNSPYYELDITSDNAIDATKGTETDAQAGLTAPTDSAAITLPSFKIKLKTTSDGTTLNGSAATATVTIPSMKIRALDEFQSWAKAREIFADHMVKGLTGTNAVVIDYVELTNAVDPASGSPAGTPYTITSETFAAINDPVVAALKKACSKEITNPLFYIEIAKETSGTDDTTCKTHATFKYDIDSLKVTLADRSNANSGGTGNPGHIDVNVKTKEKSALAVESVKFTSVSAAGTGNTKDETAIDSSSSSSPLAIAVNNGTPGSIQFMAKAAMSNDTTKTQSADFEWKVDDGANDSAEGAAIEGVTISNSGLVTIAKTVCGNASKQLNLRVTATAKTKGYGGKTESAKVYLQLTFKPNVTITLDSTNPKEIEIDAGNANATGKVFKAAMSGTNVNPADAKTVLEWKLYETTTNGAKGSEITSASVATVEACGANDDGTPGTNKNAAKVTFTNGSTLAGKEIILEATILSGSQTGYNNGTTAAASCKIKVVKDAASATRKITLTGATGVELSDVTGGAKKVVVTGTNVKIPLSVIDTKYGSRKWTYALAATGDGSANALAEGLYETTAQTAGTTTDATKPIRIETSSDGTKSWLVITDVPGGIADKSTDVAQTQVKMTAVTNPVNGEVAVNAAPLEIALVVKKNLEGMKLYEMTNDSDSTHKGSSEDNRKALVPSGKDGGVADISVEKNSASPVYVYLAAGLEGAHLAPEEKIGTINKISYKITGKSQGVKATMAQANANGVAKLTIATDSGTGYVTVTATYKSGTDKDAVIMTADRTIKVTAPQPAIQYNSAAIDASTTAVTAGTFSTGGDTSAAAFTLVNVNGAPDITWTVESMKKAGDNKDYKAYASIDDGTKKLKVKTCPYGYKSDGAEGTQGNAGNDAGGGLDPLPAGTYTATVKAAWGSTSKTADVKVVVQKVVTDITIKSVKVNDGAEVTNGNVAQSVQLKSGEASTVVVAAELAGQRLENADKAKLKYTIADGASGADAGVTPAGPTDGASATVTVPAATQGADKTFTVKFEVDSTVTTGNGYVVNANIGSGKTVTFTTVAPGP